MKNSFRIRLKMNSTNDLKCLILNRIALVHQVIIHHTLPQLRTSLFQQNFKNYSANNEPSKGIEVIIKEQDFTWSLILNLLRFLA